MFYAIQIAVAWVYGHLLEYALHRWVLHPYDKKAGAWFDFHLKEHHKSASMNQMKDCFSYRELVLVTLLLLLHLPIATVYATAYAALVASSAAYLYTHARAYRDPAWAEQAVPWHTKHHMKNPNRHWGVRSNLVDRLLGSN